MSKAILISIKPKYVKSILSGEKIVELRKIMPQCDMDDGIYVYIYCTKSGKTVFNTENISFEPNCGKMQGYKKHPQRCNGKVIGKFRLNRVYRIKTNVQYVNEDYGGYYLENNEIASDEMADNVKHTCVEDLLERTTQLTMEQIAEYSNGGQVLYGWRIDDLQIFDKPEPLHEFYAYNPLLDGDSPSNAYNDTVGDEYELAYECLPQAAYAYGIEPIKRPPQSWQYIVVEDE
ncbi:MAG: hypothetical protein FWD76_03765 [Firmicutes bacterium]|nr:hypothetical protein [Bacillota bacterium]